MLVEDYITDWIEYRAAVGAVKASTAEHYRHMLKPLFDKLGQLTIDKVSPSGVRTFVYQDVRTYGPKSAQHRFVIAKAAFAAAVKAGDIPRNPYDAIDTPKVPRNAKLKALDEAQAKRLYQRSHGYGSAGLAIRLALGTGARRGELAGFRWSDLNNAVLTVRTNVTLLSHRPVIGTPKTHGSSRTIPIPDILSRELERLKRSAIDIEQFILSGHAKPINPGHLTRRVNVALEKEGLAQFTLHNLRHTYATHLLRSGIPIKAVSERLGHSNASITLNVYAQALPQDNSAVVSALNTLYG